MAKILTDEEMGLIIHKATTDKEIIDDADTYSQFLKELGDLICCYFGAERGAVGMPDADLGWTVGFEINENVPADGGVFKDYDTDVTWKDGEETHVELKL